MKIRLLICVIASVTYYVHGKDTECNIKNDGVGICKDIDQCAELSEKAKGSARQRILQQRNCGTAGETKVCCSDCLTPDGKKGIAKHIRTCPHLYKMLTEKTDVNFVRKSRRGRKLLVCCGPDPSRELGADSITALPTPGSGHCGVDSSVSSRITGGYTTSIEQFPWTVLLEYNIDDKIKTNCGGSLISDRYVVTAAHCINIIIRKKYYSPVKVRVGEYDIENVGEDCVIFPDKSSTCTDGAESIEIESIAKHPDYVAGKNDIALIKLKYAVNITDFVRPICLPTSDTPRVADFIVTGWGKVNATTRQSKYKQAVDVKTFNAKNRFPVCKKEICAGGKQGKDSCTGDSGGPLMRMVNSDKPYFELAGVVSHGPKRCGTTGVPGVYTRVYSHINWIKQNVK